MLFNPLEYTTVFLSYDEPNCEENYQHLLTLNPNALRVHGVKGSDTAHKAVAKLSKTSSVIIVDGDNFVKPDFFHNTLVLDSNINLNTNVLSFAGRNSINGLQYGNGGIKVWPVSLIESMRTHENSDGEHKIDFDCTNYIELNTVASDVHIHCSPEQAFRSGYREGVKLCLENEEPVTFDTIDKYNFDRLWMWCHVGSDINNGYYAMYGARLGAADALSDMISFYRISDNQYVDNKLSTECNTTILNMMGEEIRHPFFRDVLNKTDSKRIRDNYINPKRSNIDYKTNRFIEWCEGFREAAKCPDINTINMMCTTGRDKPYGNDRIKGAKAGKDFTGQPYQLYDYEWLKEQYENMAIR